MDAHPSRSASHGTNNARTGSCLLLILFLFQLVAMEKHSVVDETLTSSSLANAFGAFMHSDAADRKDLFGPLHAKEENVDRFIEAQFEQQPRIKRIFDHAVDLERRVPADQIRRLLVSLCGLTKLLDSQLCICVVLSVAWGRRSQLLRACGILGRDHAVLHRSAQLSYGCGLGCNAPARRTPWTQSDNCAHCCLGFASALCSR
jgi:hypothetical protein